MSKLGVVAIALCVWLVGLVGLAAACEVNVPCESVKIIYVGKGRRHLSVGNVEIIYVASVMLIEKMSKLKEVRLNCPDETIVVRIGPSEFELPKNAISTGGDWFSVEYSTPGEALDAAMSMCPDKVKSYLQ
jgi:hypothetical protein